MPVIQSLKNILFHPLNAFSTGVETREVKEKKINNIMLNILIIASAGFAYAIYKNYPTYIATNLNDFEPTMIISSDEPYSFERATSIMNIYKPFYKAPYIPTQTFASIEAGVQHEFGDSALQFEPKDPRPKLLYLINEYDPNKALSLNRIFDFPDFKIEIGSYPLIKTLNKTHDLRLKVIKNANQICKEISSAASNNIKITSLV
ncbi:MAG: hypothetical protein H0X29_08020, partial [Parachlamydiaceae bacterium]|nr:hypothetical protein [Parachlamydiaceae bacterium]